MKAKNIISNLVSSTNESHPYLPPMLVISNEHLNSISKKLVIINQEVEETIITLSSFGKKYEARALERLLAIVTQAEETIAEVKSNIGQQHES